MTNYGWVQNTSNLSTIRDTLELVTSEGIRHIELRERIRDFRENRGDLPTRWTWDARCRIKAIHAVGLVKLNRNIQGYELTDLGRQLQNCPKPSILKRKLRILTRQETEIFKRGLLTNPPVIRVLQLLNDDRRDQHVGLSKYDVGRQLGFVGDVGFTHIDPHWVVNHGYKFANKEGDADKWARTILRWLIQVGWAVHHGYTDIRGHKLILYTSTPEVDNVLRYTVNSVRRNIPGEMLCSNHHAFPKLVQKRRALLLQALSANHLNARQLKEKLQSEGIQATETVCDFEVLNLVNAGLRIVESGGYYRLNDRIELDIEDTGTTETELEDEVSTLISNSVVRYEKTIPPKLVDHLIRYGYDGTKALEFEGVLAEYFRFLGYDADYLGQGRGRVTDILVRCKHPTRYAKSYALIVDAKATSATYRFPATDKRKMVEYIKTHGPELLKEMIPNHSFSFVSSRFVQNVRPHLQEIFSATNIKGCALPVLVLLELGNKIRRNEVRISKLYARFNTNNIFVTP